MLSDEQIATLTGDERRELIWRLARPVNDVIPRHYDAYRVRRHRVALMTLGAAVLVPWTAAAAFAALTSKAYQPADGERFAVVLCGANTDPATL